MAKSAKLLGTAIHKIQEVWKGPDELQQANYALRAYQKASISSEQCPHQSSQRLWNWWACMTQMPFGASIV